MFTWTHIKIDTRKNEQLRARQRRQRELRNLPHATPLHRPGAEDQPVTGTAILTDAEGHLVDPSLLDVLTPVESEDFSSSLHASTVGEPASNASSLHGSMRQHGSHSHGLHSPSSPGSPFSLGWSSQGARPGQAGMHQHSHPHGGRKSLLQTPQDTPPLLSATSHGVDSSGPDSGNRVVPPQHAVFTSSTTRNNQHTVHHTPVSATTSGVATFPRTSSGIFTHQSGAVSPPPHTTASPGNVFTLAPDVIHPHSPLHHHHSFSSGESHHYKSGNHSARHVSRVRPISSAHSSGGSPNSVQSHPLRPQSSQHQPMVATAIPLTQRMYVHGAAESSDIPANHPPPMPATVSPVIKKGGRIIFSEDFINNNSPISQMLQESPNNSSFSLRRQRSANDSNGNPFAGSAADSGSPNSGAPGYSSALSPVSAPASCMSAAGSPVSAMASAVASPAAPSERQLSNTSLHLTEDVKQAITEASRKELPVFKIRDSSKVYGSAEYVSQSQKNSSPTGKMHHEDRHYHNVSAARKDPQVVEKSSSKTTIKSTGKSHSKVAEEHYKHHEKYKHADVKSEGETASTSPQSAGGKCGKKTPPTGNKTASSDGYTHAGSDAEHKVVTEMRSITKRKKK